MLQRLELIGFKSFADRTRFDFADGITAIVGPNGSGKSNIVDAVRWLLGEQSAKSLRGGEMTDVIFNGSSTRKSLGMAEVSMSFDNSRRLLAVDADEVLITRRVYRDGQGEYLINGEEARLKDIKDAFLGSGAGHGAYSVIEQGRVDALLSASTRDRRIIFEEAAGISRFKSKKQETLRKLERVDADLIRVRDILAELEKQLRTLKLQAAKAERYQEHTARLRELRVTLSRREYLSLTDSLRTKEQILEALRAELADAGADSAAREEELRALEWELNRTEDTLRHQDAKLAEARQQIAIQEATANSERNQLENLEGEALRLGRQRADLTARTRRIEQEAVQLSEELERISAAMSTEKEQNTLFSTQLAELTSRIAELTRQLQFERESHFDLVNQSAKLQTEAEATFAQAERLRRESARKAEEASRIRTRHAALSRLLDDLSQSDTDIRQRLATAHRTLADHLARQEAIRIQHDQMQSELETLREQRSAWNGRAEVLEGLERSLEGLDAGVQTVLRRLRDGNPVLAAHLHGLLADLLVAPREIAPLIDLALGELAQRFLLRDNRVSLDAVLRELGELPGRVGFIPWNEPNSEPAHLRLASDFVRCEIPELASLPRSVLRGVVIVETLEDAYSLAAEQPGFRFVTRQGDILEADGTVIVGPAQSGVGILSRKSELRELQSQIRTQEARILALETDQATLRTQAEELNGPIREWEAEIAALTGEVGTLRDQIVEQRQVQKQLADMLEVITQELLILQQELDRADAGRLALQEQLALVTDEAQRTKTRLAASEEDLARTEQARENKSREHTESQVALGRVSEQLANLGRKREETETDLRRRRIEAVNITAMERSLRERLLATTLTTLRAGAAAAALYAEKETRERAVVEWSTRREELRRRRETVQVAITHVRETWKDRQDERHAHELTVRDLSARRDSVAQRIQDEYGITLTEDEPILLSAADAASTDAEPSEVEPEEIAPQLVPETAHKEMDELRRKIAKLGSVNLEALDELAEVEAREHSMRTQFDDLAESRRKLQEIIDQINVDSRRLFSETLAAVRTHFQELFRKLFGGGMADIILEDESDVLESGIEITARPPGKELQRISLLSGGERALTAVALLLAIFRSRPSPFCLLDEVDAAMDEANTQRLADLLREFSDRSQFIVITHKKRTMAVADVLHGVTMQESGISRMIGVRFEDWPEESDVIRHAA